MKLKKVTLSPVLTQLSMVVSTGIYFIQVWIQWQMFVPTHCPGFAEENQFLCMLQNETLTSCQVDRDLVRHQFARKQHFFLPALSHGA